MADVITRFKLETTQYDSALRDAAKGLSDLTKQLQLAGNDFNRFAEKNVETARSLGKVESGASDVKDKLRDLVSAYNNVAKAYNNLTKEQQQSDFGKAMAQSLKELQGRIKDTKKEIEDLKDKSKGTGGILDQLAAKFGISTKALTTWGAALGAGAAALKVAKDAFFASEQNLDDWNRMVYSSQSTYEAFLTSLNTGDVSGFLDRIGQITQAAFDAYNAIDRLQTMKTIQSPQVAKKQAEVQRMEMMLRTGRYVAPVDGRTSTEGLKTGDILTDAQKKNIADNLASGMKEIAALTKNEVQASTEAINRLYEEQALRLGMSNEEFKKGTASMAAFDSAIEKARKYQEFEAQHTSRTQMSTSAGVITQNVRDNAVNPYERYKNWSVFKDDGKLYQEIVNLIKQRSQQESQYYGELGRAYRSINRTEGVRVGGTGSTTSQTDQEKAQAKYDQAIKDYSQALEAATLAVNSGQADTVAAKKKELSAAESLWKAIVDAREIYDDPKFKEAQENVAAKVVELGGSVNALVEEQKKAQEAAREMAAAQKKVASALEEASTAYSANDLKGYMSALRKVDGDYTQGMQKGNFSYTSSNLSAFTAYLNERLAQADLGTTLYQNLTKQLADANMLANLMETAVKNGIDIAQFDPQALFDKIFSSTPGDYIENMDWKSIQDAINEELKKMNIDPIQLNFETGDINNDKKNKEKEIDGTKQFRSLVGDVSTIVGSLQQLGMDVPEGFQKTLGVMQVVTTILMTLQSLAGITAATSAVKSIPIIGWFLQNGGVLHAADGWSGIVPGNSFSGDNIPALLNSGETVLNKAQSGVIAAALTSAENGYGDVEGETRIESDQMVLLLRNGAARRGQTIGEYLGL